MDPAELRLKNFIQPDQFPYTSKTGWVYDSGDYEPAMRQAMEMAGYDELRREQAEKRGQGRADGHRRRVLHRGRRRRAPQGHGHPRPRHGRRQRAAGPPHRQGDPAGVVHEPGPGPRDDLRPDRGRGARHPAGGHPGGQRRHREHAVRPRHLRQPLDAGVGRGRGAGRPQGAGQGADHRLGDARGVGGRPRVGQGLVPGEGRPVRVGHHPGHRHAGPRRRRSARGDRGRPRSADLLQPVEPHLPVRRLHLRGRRRPRHRAGEGALGSSPSTTAAPASTR